MGLLVGLDSDVRAADCYTDGCASHSHTGAATVIPAMGADKRAAAGIDRFLRGETIPAGEAGAVATAG